MQNANNRVWNKNNKVAVVLSGLARFNDAADFALENVRQIFPYADVYATYWDDSPHPPKTNSSLINQGRGIFVLPTPLLSYHPFNTKFFPEWWKLPKYADRKEQKFLTGHLQILAHALTKMLFVEEDKYDVIIRARWDCAFNPLEDWIAHIKMAYMEQKIRGFKSLSGTVVSRYQHTFDGREIASLPRTLKALTETAELFDNPLNANNQAPYFLPSLLQDFCIIYPTKAFDSGKAIQLFNDQELLGCEFGWTQMLLKNNAYSYEWESFRGSVIKIWGSSFEPSDDI